MNEVNLPAEWTTSHFEELSINFDGKRRPVKESDRRSGPFPYYGASGVVDHVDDYLFDGEYLLVAEDGENLRTRQTPIAFLARGKFWVNNHAHIVAGNERADTRFLMYALRYVGIDAYLTGAVMPKLTQGNLNRIKVSHPPINEQRAIADVLGALDDKIEQNRRTAQALERLAQAIFRSWFVDFEPVKAKAAGATAFPSMPQPVFGVLPTRLVDSDIGPVPEGWEVATVGDCASYLNRGITPRYVEEGGVLVLNQKCIRDFAIDCGKARRHDTSSRGIEGREVKVGDVLINSTGVGTLGRLAQVLHLPEVAVVDTHVTVVRPSLRVNASYLGQALISMQPHIESLGEGSTGQTELNRRKIADLKLVVPSAQPLAAFQESAAPLMDLVSLAQLENLTLAAMRDYLLPKLLSGEVRVRDAEHLVAASA